MWRSPQPSRTSGLVPRSPAASRARAATPAARAPGASMDAESMAALAETFRILGDTTRVRILDVIATSERCVRDIAQAVALSESAVSHQLRLLRTHRLVRPRRTGRQVFYTLDDHHIVGLLAQGLEHVTERLPPAGARTPKVRR